MYGEQKGCSSHPGLPRTLALKVCHPGIPLRPRQTGQLVTLLREGRVASSEMSASISQNVFSKMLSTLLPRALTAVWLQMVPLRNKLERPQGYPRIEEQGNGFPQCQLLRTSNTLWSCTLSERRIDCPAFLKVFEAGFFVKHLIS